MIIAHISYSFGLGGIETMLTNIANEQSDSGHEIHIIIINDYVESTLLNRLSTKISFHCLRHKPGSRNPLPAINLNILLRRINPDIIHLHYASIVRLIFGKSLKKRLCVTLHDMCTPTNSKYLPKAGPVFAISEMVKDDIKNFMGLDSITVDNGVNVGLISKKETLEKNGNIIKIVQVSRLMHKKKGQDILIKAVAKLYNKGIKNIRLDFIGEGESEEYLRALVSEMKLDDVVSFLGSKSQEYIFEHLKDYDLFVQPSRFEGFGLTVAEAMAAGVPVLVSDNQAPMEIIVNGLYGYHFKGEDDEDCAKEIEKFITEGIDKEKTEMARQYVCEKYSVSVTAAKYLDLYDKLIVKKGS